jgi:hypothetical protein
MDLRVARTTLRGRSWLEKDAAKSAAQSMARRDVQHQKETDRTRRERKQGDLKVVANDRRWRVAHCPGAACCLGQRPTTM